MRVGHARAARVDDARIVFPHRGLQPQRVFEFFFGDVVRIEAQAFAFVGLGDTFGQARVRVVGHETRRIHDLAHAGAQTVAGEIARAQRSLRAAYEDAQRERASRRLFELLDARAARFGAEAFRDRAGRFGLRRSRGERFRHCEAGEFQRFRQPPNLRPSRARV